MVRVRFSWMALILLLAVSVLVGCDDPMGDALALEKDGDWEGALVIYQRVLAEDPTDLEALSGMATGLWLLGRYDQALPFQLKVVSVDAEDVQTRVELAFNYVNYQDRAADAVNVLQEAVFIDRSARLLTYLGQAQREAGDLKAAESSFAEAIAVDATYGYAYFQLTRLLETQGRTEDAATVVESAERNGVELAEFGNDAAR